MQLDGEHVPSVCAWPRSFPAQSTEGETEEPSALLGCSCLHCQGQTRGLRLGTRVHAVMCTCDKACVEVRTIQEWVS